MRFGGAVQSTSEYNVATNEVEVKAIELPQLSFFLAWPNDNRYAHEGEKRKEIVCERKIAEDMLAKQLCKILMQ